jgi:hypothetical protein
MKRFVEGVDRGQSTLFPEEASSSGKGLSEAARSGLKIRRKGGRRALPLRGAAPPPVERRGYGPGGRIERRRTSARVRASARLCLRP